MDVAMEKRNLSLVVVAAVLMNWTEESGWLLYCGVGQDGSQF